MYDDTCFPYQPNAFEWQRYLYLVQSLEHNSSLAPKWDGEKEKFKDMPTATADFKLTGTDADIRMMQEVKNLN
jgi:hypothetical protein